MASGSPRSHAHPHATHRLEQGRNELGGVLVDPEEVRKMFECFDVNHRGSLEKEEVLEMLEVLFPGENHKADVRALCGKDGLTAQRLQDLLMDNELKAGESSAARRLIAPAPTLSLES
eukprot:CAMPEP_0197616970 /NCGR_PEP_ID=MMETSP1326-20131121/60798_1 /TAXON_ID=1155430 /ORGANISM="Genus nov. species nov., Strain RCC2288" /LENGTH=117 /DNA_ID=CAMNT_0043185859 /DNA_START=35 /DNA_END=388 /DNA_ORIENTATION=+